MMLPIFGSKLMTLVDEDIFLEYLHAKLYLSGGYVKRHSNNGIKYLLHRDILGLKETDALDVDHINGDKLDNRRCNLRTCSHSNNCRNYIKKSLFATKTSKYIGVFWRKDRKIWAARIRDKFGNKLHLGHFTVELDAALAYDKYASKHFPDFAKLNFPKV